MLHQSYSQQRIQDPSISAEAVKRCKAFIADPNNAATLNADIRLAVFDVTVKSEGDAMFDELIKAHDALRKIQKNGPQKTGVGKLIEYSGKRTSQTISFWGGLYNEFECHLFPLSNMCSSFEVTPFRAEIPAFLRTW